mmetsp:Transcript_19745/g.35090  ORF Transcript_19745/g.35090 Transcript_19745/m.35090 type:complete len:339 (+) Transcript_19745:61-1077(+)
MAPAPIRLRELSAREQRAAYIKELANPDGHAKPLDGGHLKLNQHQDVAMQPWQTKIIDFLHGDAVHRFLTGCLVLDICIVMATIQLTLEISAMQGNSYHMCIESFAKGPAWVDAACATSSEAYQMAEVYEEVEFVLGCVSLGILLIFLIENALLIVATGRRFFHSFFFVLDLVAVLISLASEIYTTVSHLSHSHSHSHGAGTSLNSSNESHSSGAVAGHRLLATSTSSASTSSSTSSSSLEHAVLITGMLVCIRLWRLFRIAHGAYYLCEVDEQELGGHHGDKHHGGGNEGDEHDSGGQHHESSQQAANEAEADESKVTTTAHLDSDDGPRERRKMAL